MNSLRIELDEATYVTLKMRAAAEQTSMKAVVVEALHMLEKQRHKDAVAEARRQLATMVAMPVEELVQELLQYGIALSTDGTNLEYRIDFRTKKKPHEYLFMADIDGDGLATLLKQRRGELMAILQGQGASDGWVDSLCREASL